tara:strand:- start:93 stop:281 length:189 start_codon:yes stop_codon:yes gene_type:complete
MSNIKERETAPLGSTLMPTTKVLICDRCGTAGDEENEVWEWGNPYDFGTICADCQEDVNESR